MGIRRFGRLLGRLIALGIGLWALSVLFVAATITLWPDDSPPPAAADAIICLGAGLSRADPTLPGPASERRAMTCAALHDAGVAPVVVFSGYGTTRRAVADAMADRAVAAGLPAEAALREPDARSTIQNAAYALALLPDGADRVVVVSDPFHLPRAWLIFKALGVNEVSLHAAGPIAGHVPHPDDRSMWDWALRESLAIWWNVGRAATYVTMGAFGVDHDTRISWFN